ncbi:hypothetical protein OKA04_07765 [Luteolibacter flavescens]|uniref:HEAT repeat domain-containing protein n=1 Tax=Luteolibacter flavescens TaxID=1859460 RepID=A0ABT3FM30_9BACT|nr:hypothetical protein [Luteolibacter flavescens]MCW1884626.1 hypothetical protein [Luteolibacter flavescens]
MKLSRRSLVILSGIACVAVAGWSGYRAERWAMSAAGAPQRSVGMMVKRLVTPAAKLAGVDRLEELRQSVGRQYPTSAEISGLWSVVRGFSLEEVKSALDSLPEPGSPGQLVNEVIADMLHYRWAQLDPQAAAVAAVNAASAHSERRFLPYAVLAAWAQSDPDAAIRWARESGDPYAKNAAMNLAAMQWVAADPATALSRARSGYPEAARGVTRSLIDKLSTTPESRQQLFTILTPEDLGDLEPEVLSRLALELGRIEPGRMEELVAELSQAGWTEERIQKVREGSQRYGYSYEEPETDIANTGSGKTDGARRLKYPSWVLDHPQQALEWAESRGDAEIVSSTVESLSGRLLQSSWSPGQDQQRQWVTSIRKQYTVWERMDGEAARTWLEDMPADMKKIINAPQDDAAR